MLAIITFTHGHLTFWICNKIYCVVILNKHIDAAISFKFPSKNSLEWNALFKGSRKNIQN